MTEPGIKIIHRMKQILNGLNTQRHLTLNDPFFKVNSENLYKYTPNDLRIDTCSSKLVDEYVSIFRLLFWPVK